MRDPLILPFFAFAAGIVAARAGGVTAREAAWACAAFALLACLSRYCCPRRFLLVPILSVVAALGALDMGLQTHTPPVPAPLEAGSVQAVQGCLMENGDYRDGLLRLKIDLQPGAGVYATVAPERDTPLPPLPLAGTLVALTGKIHAPRAYRNPGSFDFGAYLARQDIFWTLSAKASTYRVLPGGCGPAWRAVLGRVRQNGLDALDRLYAGDDYARGMMRGLLLGDSSGIRDVWTRDWRRTGTYHALVISGSQITFVTMLALLWLRIARAGERQLLVFAAALGWVYALLCGGHAPVLRAAAGFTLYACARLLYRRPRLVNLLAVAALAFLACAPDELFDASFQLTFLSVAAVGAMAIPLTRRWFTPWHAALRSLSAPNVEPYLDPRAASIRTELLLFAATISALFRCPVSWAAMALRALGSLVLRCVQLMLLSACVQWMLAIPMIIYFHRLSISGLTANIVVIPLVSLAIPLGFAAIASGWHFPAMIALWMLRGAQWTATAHARWEPKWRVPDPPMAALIVFFLLLAWFCFALRRGSRWTPGAAAASLAVLVLIVVHPFPSDLRPGVLEVAMIDVGQGDSILLGLPSGGAALVDTGGILSFGKPRPRDSGFDIGEDVVSPYLWRRGLRRLEVLMISHPHADHIGGAPAILENFHPREVWGAFDLDVPEWHRLAGLARAAGCRVRSLHRGEVFDAGGLRWEVLAPLPNLRKRDVNEASLVVRATYGRHSLLLTGDMDRRTEALLLEAGYNQRVDILKVAHHGSKNASLPRFLDVLKPALAMVSAGFENNYGHPNPVTLTSLEKRHIQLLRTDLMGLVVARSNARYLEIEGHSEGFALPPVWDDY
jgi:competence protein ComEC